MGLRFKKRRHARKRTFRKKRKATLSREIVPKTLTRSFTYVDNFLLAPGVAGSVSESTYVANGMFDPDFNGVGHQPYGFDQWMAWYNHFSVTSAKITATFSYVDPNTDGHLYGGVCHIRLDDAGDHETVRSHIYEMPGTTFRSIGVDGKATMLTKTFNGRRFFGGVSKVALSQYEGSAVANPLERAYFILGYSAGDGNTAIPLGFGVQVDIKITYTAVLTERREVPQS